MRVHEAMRNLRLPAQGGPKTIEGPILLPSSCLFLSSWTPESPSPKYSHKQFIYPSVYSLQIKTKRNQTLASLPIKIPIDFVGPSTQLEGDLYDGERNLSMTGRVVSDIGEVPQPNTTHKGLILSNRICTRQMFQEVKQTTTTTTKNGFPATLTGRLQPHIL